MSATQITPVSELQKNYGEVLKRLEAGPVFLAQRSKPVGVILSPGDYDKLNSELKRLQRIISYDKQFAEIRAGNYTELPETATT